MNIPSAKTLRDMETAADLRAQGASWETIGHKLHRHPTLLMRWARVYRDDWELMLREAERRLSLQAGNEGRTVLRRLLGHKDPKVQHGAAKELCHLRLEEKADEPPPNPHANMSAFFALLQEMSHDELKQRLREFAEQARAEEKANTPGSAPDARPEQGDGAQPPGTAADPDAGMADPPGAAGPG